MADNETCPGCGRTFHHDDITGILPNVAPNLRPEPDRKWHLGCHQKAYARWQERGDGARLGLDDPHIDLQK
jgi:hypothetical protein